MAKGLTLISTNIREMKLFVSDHDNDASVKVLYEINDDQGTKVKSELYSVMYSDLPTQCKAALNTALNLISKEINNSAVNENTGTWDAIL
jgi:hypothetical protein